MEPVVIIVEQKSDSGSSSSGGCRTIFFFVCKIMLSMTIGCILLGPVSFMFGNLLGNSQKIDCSPLPLGFIPSHIFTFYEWVGDAVTSFARLFGNCFSAVWNNQITPFPNFNFIIAIVLFAATLPLLYWTGHRMITKSLFLRSAILLLTLLYIPWAIFILYLIVLLISVAVTALFGWLFSK